MPCPILSVQQMREWEARTWDAGITQTDVIERVGRLVAARAERLARGGGRILVLAGKGHNGDDARAAARHLGPRSILIDSVKPDFDLNSIPAVELIVDGVFGIGLNRPLSADWIHFFEAINALRGAVLAIDVPSGLNAETGCPEGAAIRATVTLTLGAPKAGMIKESAWPFVGRLELADDIGLALPFRPSPTEMQWSERTDFGNFPPGRFVASHKGIYGHVVIFAGSPGYHGAAVLAARAALRARPGLVTVFTHEKTYIPVASQLQAAMVHPWVAGAQLPESCTAVVFGPGLASVQVPEAARAELAGFWRELPFPVVADASALGWLEPGANGAEAMRVMTPHPGEAARLLQTTSAAVQENRVGVLRRLSERYGGCWVVLKGHQTLLGKGKENVLVNSSGNPYLAQGGTGDVLAGFLGGLLAQEQLAASPEKVLAYGVWKHGEAADLLCERDGVWGAEDLSGEI